jgi:hypothetical protein
MAYGGGFIDAFDRYAEKNPARPEGLRRGTIPQLSHVGR